MDREKDAYISTREESQTTEGVDPADSLVNQDESTHMQRSARQCTDTVYTSCKGMVQHHRKISRTQDPLIVAQKSNKGAEDYVLGHAVRHVLSQRHKPATAASVRMCKRLGYAQS